MTANRVVRRWRVGVGGLLGLALWIGAPEHGERIVAQSSPTPLSFTTAQADAGQVAYVEHCATCHGDSMDDGEFAPTLKGADFREQWRSQSPEALYTLTRSTMPQESTRRAHG